MSAVTIQDIQCVLNRAERLLDDEQWADWLQCYDANARFWMPKSAIPGCISGPAWPPITT